MIGGQRAARQLARDRAHDEAMASLRSAALVRSLVQQTTGLRPGDGENFETAIEYVQVNLKHHRFSDLGTDGRSVRAMYEGLLEKLDRHAEHAKAMALRKLCTALLSEPSMDAAWAWSATHSNVNRGIEVLVMLYWLSNTSRMLRSHSQSASSSMPASLLRMESAVASEKEVAARQLAAWQGSGDRTGDRLAWGFSSDEDDAVEEEPAQQLNDAAADENVHGDSTPRQAARTHDEGTAAHHSTGAHGLSESSDTGEPRKQPSHRELLERDRSIATPPDGISYDYLLPTGNTSAVHPGRGYFPPLQATNKELARATRLGGLRILRESLRALVVPPKVNGSVCDAEGHIWHLSGKLGSALLKRQPSALRSALESLDRTVQRSMRVDTFVQSLLTQPRVPCVLAALADAIAAELKPLRGWLWSIDAQARNMHQTVAQGGGCLPGSKTEPSVLSLAALLRRGDVADEYAGGWARKLCALDELCQVLLADENVRAVVQGETGGPDTRAAAAAHTLNAVADAFREEQSMGEMTGCEDGEADELAGLGEEEATAPVLHGARSELFAGDSSATNAQSPGAAACYSLPRRTRPKAGTCNPDQRMCTLLPMLLRLVVRSFVPYLKLLSQWVIDGQLLSEELLVVCNDSVSVGETELHWQSGFRLRGDESIPAVLHPIAPRILLAGKSRHLLHRMGTIDAYSTLSRDAGAFEGHEDDVSDEVKGEVEEYGDGEVELVPLDELFCDGLLRWLEILERQSAHKQEGSQESSSGDCAGPVAATPDKKPATASVAHQCNEGSTNDKLSVPFPLGKDQYLDPGRSNLVPRQPQPHELPHHIRDAATVGNGDDDARGGTAGAEGDKGVVASIGAADDDNRSNFKADKDDQGDQGRGNGNSDVDNSDNSSNKGATKDHQGEKDEGEGGEGDGEASGEECSDADSHDERKYSYRMADCTGTFALPKPLRVRTEAERLEDARNSLCWLPIEIDRPEEVDSEAMSQLHRAIGVDALSLHDVAAYMCTANSGKFGTNMEHFDIYDPARKRSYKPPVWHAACTVLSLPPLNLLLENCLIAPLHELCALAGPELLVTSTATSHPLLVASLLHRTLLFGEPRLTAPLFESLFGRLGVHRAWRKQLPELHAILIDGLVAADVPLHAAQCFSLELSTDSERARGQQQATNEQPGSDGGAHARATTGSASGLDAADTRALSDLRLRYSVKWPLQLTISVKSLRTHEAVFTLLLQLRRARWSLESVGMSIGEQTSSDPSPRRMGNPLLSARAAPNSWRNSHPWRVLRSEVLHLITSVYSHLTLGVIHPEWRTFVASVPSITHVDAFREAHEAFVERIFRRCLLRPQHAPIVSAIERILGLALRLRMQLESLPHLSVNVHASSAKRWRAELRTGVQFVIDELRNAARKEVGEASSELIELCSLIDYNGYYARADANYR